MSEFTMLEDLVENTNGGTDQSNFSVYWSGSPREHVEAAAIAVAHLWKALSAQGSIIGGSRWMPVKVTLVRVGRTTLTIFTLKMGNVWRFIGCTGKIAEEGPSRLTSRLELELWEASEIKQWLSGEGKHMCFEKPN
ncbi:hypothetical protein EYR38_007801 [Pleurotus pulmonarius]|nr:hypothetical protein EYR38_007801 [Pleurotus pulmonarius]